MCVLSWLLTGYELSTEEAISHGTSNYTASIIQITHPNVSILGKSNSPEQALNALKEKSFNILQIVCIVKLQ